MNARYINRKENYSCKFHFLITGKNRNPSLPTPALHPYTCIWNSHFGYLYTRRCRNSRRPHWRVFNPVKKWENIQELRAGTGVILLHVGLCSCWANTFSQPILSPGPYLSSRGLPQGAILTPVGMTTFPLVLYRYGKILFSAWPVSFLSSAELCSICF